MEEMWSKVLHVLQRDIMKPSFETWLSNTTGELQDDTLIVHAPNEFSRDWIESRYKTHIANAVKEVTGKDVHVEVQSGLGEPEYQQEFKAPVRPKQSLEDRVARLEKTLDFKMNDEDSPIDYITGQILALDQQSQRQLIQKLNQEHDLPIQQWIADDKT